MLCGLDRDGNVVPIGPISKPISDAEIATERLINEFRARGVRVAFRGLNEPETGAPVELVDVWFDD